MAQTTVARLSREELLLRLEAVFHPKEGEFTSDRIDEMLLEFCMNCPDPGAAMDLVVEAPQGTTSSQVLAAALAMATRRLSSYSEAELSLDHPLRHLRVLPNAV